MITLGKLLNVYSIFFMIVGFELIISAPPGNYQCIYDDIVDNEQQFYDCCTNFCGGMSLDAKYVCRIIRGPYPWGCRHMECACICFPSEGYVVLGNANCTTCQNCIDFWAWCPSLDPDSWSDCHDVIDW